MITFTSAEAARSAAAIRAAADLVEQAGIGGLAVSCHRDRIVIHVGERDGDPQARARTVAAVAGVLGCVPAQTSSPASADAWLAETFTHRYPDALERIARGHTRVTLNPASIIVSLKNGYIHSGWLIKRGAVLTKSGGTHGALDDLNSDGILVSSFAITKDTSTSRVAALFDGFKGRRDVRNIAGNKNSVAADVSPR